MLNLVKNNRRSLVVISIIVVSLILLSIILFDPVGRDASSAWSLGIIASLIILRIVFVSYNDSLQLNLVLEVLIALGLFILYPPILGMLSLVGYAAVAHMLYEPERIQPKQISLHNISPLFSLSLAFIRGVLFSQGIKVSLMNFSDFSNVQIGIIGSSSIAVLFVQHLVSMPKAYDSLRTELARREKKWTMDVLSLLSHNIRTPITAISNRVEILRLKKAGGMEITQDDIDGLEESNESVQSIVHQLLDTTARNMMHSTNVAISSLHAVLEHIQEDIIIKNDDGVDFDLPSTSAISLQLCLDSLLSNARKYGGDKIYILIEEGKKSHFIAVQDFGQGMDEEQLAHYGTPFNNRKSKGGTGLGVYFTLGIIKELGWNWDIKSVLDKGTTVTIDIPKSTLTL